MEDVSKGILIVALIGGVPALAVYLWLGLAFLTDRLDNDSDGYTPARYYRPPTIAPPLLTLAPAPARPKKTYSSPMLTKHRRPGNAALAALNVPGPAIQAPAAPAAEISPLRRKRRSL